MKGIIGPSGSPYRETCCPNRTEIRGRETTVPLNIPGQPWFLTSTFIVSEDGERITERAKYRDGRVLDNVYFWQR